MPQIVRIVTHINILIWVYIYNNRRTPHPQTVNNPFNGLFVFEQGFVAFQFNIKAFEPLAADFFNSGYERTGNFAGMGGIEAERERFADSIDLLGIFVFNGQLYHTYKRSEFILGALLKEFFIDELSI